MLFFIYFSVSHKVFGVFGCTLFDEGDGKKYLNLFPWIECQPASEVYLRMMGLTIPVFVLFIIGFPTYLWMKCRDSSLHTDEALKYRYSYLVLPYKDVTISLNIVIILYKTIQHFIFF